MFSSWHLSSSDTQKIFQILCRLKLKAQELLTNVSAIDLKVRLQRLCFQLHIDQMSIKIESSRNFTNVSAI